MNGTLANKIGLTASFLLTMACGSKYVSLPEKDCGKGFYAAEDGSCIRWNEGAISYSLDSVVRASFSEAEINTGIIDGCFGSKGFSAYFAPTSKYSFPNAGDMKEACNDQVEDGKIKLGGYTSWPADKSKNIQAFTRINTSGNQIIGAMICLNLQHFKFTTTGESGTVDLRSVMCHEIGHALGMMHTTEDSTAMLYPTLAYAFMREFTVVDLSNFWNVYPKNTAAAIPAPLKKAKKTGATPAVVAGASTWSGDAASEAEPEEDRSLASEDPHKDCHTELYAAAKPKKKSESTDESASDASSADTNDSSKTDSPARVGAQPGTAGAVLKTDE